jgi:hypothetical protein
LRLKIGMRASTGTDSHEPVVAGARKFQRPTRVRATKVTPRFASHTPGPSLPSGVSRKSPGVLAARLAADDHDPASAVKPRRLGVRITTTCVNSWPKEDEVDVLDAFGIAVVAG